MVFSGESIVERCSLIAEGWDTVQSVALQAALNARFDTKECISETNNKIQLTMKEKFLCSTKVSLTEFSGTTF